jgi:tRNA (guanine37-N1)-methyltransferase
MHISIVTVFPDLYTSFINTSLIKRAQETGAVQFDIDSFFSFVQPKERIDAPSFGHGAGMLIKPRVVQSAVDDKEKKFGKAYKIFFSPQGAKLDQAKLREIAQKIKESGHLMLLPARYEGMDNRVEEAYADEIISIGDFVLMGGDLPAMILLEGLLRLVPGVVGKEESVQADSFTGPFVDYPEYTEPVEWNGNTVPDIVRSGNHGAIREWRMAQAVHTSVRNHFSWVRSHAVRDNDKQLAAQAIPPHYVALVHGDVLIGGDRPVGTTSVTSIDLHDISRSSSTYGIKQFFVVTPLIDQQKIVRKLLDFWMSHGITYNRNRHEAIQILTMTDTIEQTIAEITEKEGKAPVVIATSAMMLPDTQMLTYYDQAKAWHSDRPVLLVFGTGKGLRPEFIKSCDYQLLPIEGFTQFNHLSVRSAVATVLDRWLGINLVSTAQVKVADR